MITALIIYSIGIILAFLMQRTEFAAEKVNYTKGLRAISYLLSLLSFGIILWMLVAAWIQLIGLTGYWDQPVKSSEPDSK